MLLQKTQASSDEQDTEEEDKRKTKVRRIQEERDHTEVEEEEVYAMAYKEEVARRIDLERKLEECQAVNEKLLSELEESIKVKEAEAQVQESSQAEIADLNNKLERENAARVKAEGRVQTLNDKLLVRLTGNQIVVQILDCLRDNWQQMIESGDVTAGEMSVYSSTMLPCILIEMRVTALHMAAVKGNVEMIRLLLPHPEIDVNAVDRKWDFMLK
eukprot:scaffold4379_cov166-Ochromonas_danica.AAC.1